jgi:hypothetical protein
MLLLSVLAFDQIKPDSNQPFASAKNIQFPPHIYIPGQQTIAGLPASSRPGTRVHAARSTFV